MFRKILFLLLILPDISFAYVNSYSSYPDEYWIKCTKSGEVKNLYGSFPTVSMSYCKELLDDICSGKTYSEGTHVTNRLYEALSHFYEDGEQITAGSVNQMCKDNMKVLK